MTVAKLPGNVWTLIEPGRVNVETDGCTSMVVAVKVLPELKIVRVMVAEVPGNVETLIESGRVVVEM